jgi:NTE family protein
MKGNVMTNSLAKEVSDLGQTVLVLQGGGALGAYQLGVYEALHEAGVAPDWVIGTSIGAINAALIAGSKPEERIEKMCDFWSRVENDAFVPFGLPSWMESATRNWLSVTTGVPGFFSPNPLAFLSPHQPLGTDSAGYYTVDPLRRTLQELIDFKQLNGGETRITVGASNVRTAEMRYFDSRDMPLGLDHILASGALPPAFPPVRIDGELYWDGGILSNTPVEVVFDDNPRRDSLVFAVHIWNPHGPAPETIWEVMNRQKDVQYSSRAVSHIQRQRQIHRMRHIIAELSKMLPEEIRRSNEFAEMAAYGCLTRMHVVRLLAPALDHEDHSKDIDFSASGIRRRREAGYRDTMRTLEKSPWQNPVDELEGFILHEASGGEMVDTAAASTP